MIIKIPSIGCCFSELIVWIGAGAPKEKNFLNFNLLVLGKIEKDGRKEKRECGVIKGRRC
jgi:hypothetical protein